MTKDVLISISGYHYGDWNLDEEEVEPIEIITPASYYLKNGKHYVIYDEVMEGVPGAIRNTVKITRDRMFEITKGGHAGTRMVFEKDMTHRTIYQTPYGDVLIGIYTMDIQVSEHEEHIDVQILYELDVNEEPMAECRLKVNIRSVG